MDDFEYDYFFGNIITYDGTYFVKIDLRIVEVELFKKEVVAFYDSLVDAILEGAYISIDSVPDTRGLNAKAEEDISSFTKDISDFAFTAFNPLERIEIGQFVNNDLRILQHDDDEMREYAYNLFNS